MKKMRWAIAVCAAVLLCGTAAAQEPKQEPSLAEAARRARLEKEKARQAKSERVWTNDNLPKSGGAVSVTGAAAPTDTPVSGSGGAVVPTGAAAGAAGEENPEIAKLEKELADLKQRLGTAQKDLELLSRDFDLQRQQFYSNPQYNSNSAGKAQLDALESQKNAKQQDVESLKQEIAALEDKLKALRAESPEKPAGPKTEAEQRASWQAKIQPLRDELARVEEEIRRTRAPQSVAPGSTVQGDFGGLTADNVQRLEQRKHDLEQKIAAIEDDARRDGIPPAWLR
jgi:chromosome segregation ATPase